MKFLSDINLRESIGIDFTTNTEESRRLYWDDFNRTLSLELGNGIIEQIGKELYIDVRNMGTSIIPNGTLIQGIGTVGESGRIIVQPTIADGTIAPETILGIATEDILVGEDGLATFFGAIHDIDTTGTSVGETWTMGDKLYANPNYSGGLTNVEPQAPNLKVAIGIVLYANALEGSILVNINYGSNFGSDHNVQFTNLLDGQLTMYNDTNKRWENINVSTLVLAASQSNVVDTGGYFSGTNVETVLQELGSAIGSISTTSSVVAEGTGIDVSSITEGSVTTYTVSHEDTSTLSGDYGTAGIATITLDAMGHITAVSTANYLTTNSMDFAQVNVTDNDTGYNWQETGTIIADQVGDTLTFVSDGGININVDPNADAIQIVNTDKGSSQNIFKNISVSGQPTLVADNNNDNLNLASGSNVTITTNAETDTITISSTDTIYTHPTGDGNLHVPATGTTNNGKVLTAGETAGSLSWQTPTGGGTDWSGTKAEYDAIVTKDPDTYYFITDELVGAQSVSYSNALTGLNAVHVQQAIDELNTTLSTKLTTTGLLNAIKAVDGNGSGIDADLLDGRHATGYTQWGQLSAANLDTLVTPGIWSCDPNCLSMPIATWGSIVVSYISHTRWVQQFFMGQSGDLFYRVSWDTGPAISWHAWQRVISASGGTMAGILTAQSNTAYTTRQVRNIIVDVNDANLAAMQNGDIWIKI